MRSALQKEAADSIGPMENLDNDSSVPDWLIEYPQLLPLFEELGIDYCCAGKSLGAACQQAGIDSRYVLRRVEDVLENSQSQ